MKNVRMVLVVWFLLGFGFFMFTRMSLLLPTMPIAILIAQVFILRFIRTQPAGRGNLLTFLGFFATINVALFGIFDMGGGTASVTCNVIRSTLLAILYFLPYMADRLIYPLFKGVKGLSTLIFPVITTALFFLLAIEGPFEGFYQMGKFLYGPIAFKQMISLFGMPGAVFVTSWFASAVNSCWERGFQWRNSKRVVFTNGFAALAVPAFGVVKTSPLALPESETVKTASAVFIPEDGQAERLVPLLESRYTHPYQERLTWFVEKTHIASSRGAKIVMFYELAMLIDEEVREDFIAQYRRIADQNKVYLAMNYGY